jgi:DNA-binding transcriptional regulator YhcF (GntR family)
MAASYSNTAVGPSSTRWPEHHRQVASLALMVAHFFYKPHVSVIMDTYFRVSIEGCEKTATGPNAGGISIAKLPSAKCRDSDIATELNMSLKTVREALNRLKSDGILQTSKGDDREIKNEDMKRLLTEDDAEGLNTEFIESVRGRGRSSVWTMEYHTFLRMFRYRVHCMREMCAGDEESNEDVYRCPDPNCLYKDKRYQLMDLLIARDPNSTDGTFRCQHQFCNCELVNSSTQNHQQDIKKRLNDQLSPLMDQARAVERALDILAQDVDAQQQREIDMIANSEENEDHSEIFKRQAQTAQRRRELDAAGIVDPRMRRMLANNKASKQRLQAGLSAGETKLNVGDSLSRKRKANGDLEQSTNDADNKDANSNSSTNDSSTADAGGSASITPTADAGSTSSSLPWLQQAEQMRAAEQKRAADAKLAELEEQERRAKESTEQAKIRALEAEELARQMRLAEQQKHTAIHGSGSAGASIGAQGDNHDDDDDDELDEELLAALEDFEDDSDD